MRHRAVHVPGHGLAYVRMQPGGGWTWGCRCEAAGGALTQSEARSAHRDHKVEKKAARAA
jgi:hypothetical protein